MRILVLGGTRFLGRHLVPAAEERGHEVTLFHRGVSNPGLFPGRDVRIGDRDPRVGEGLAALDTGEWDAVVDTSAHFPRLVTAAARRLADRAGQYVYVSSLSVYGSFERVGIEEDAPPARMADPTIEDFGASFENYGALKALSEEAAEACFPGRTTRVRPGLIVGPHDNIPRFTWWPVRVARGGEVLAPGHPDDPVQFIDVRDLARWLVHCVEERVVGAFNVNGPQEGITIGSLLDVCRDVSGSSARFTWVDADTLETLGLAGWSDLPLWMAPRGGYAGFHRMNCGRAYAAGLTTRPVADTIRDTLAWYAAWNPGTPFPWRGGMTPEREAQALAAVRERAGNETQ